MVMFGVGPPVAVSDILSSPCKIAKWKRSSEQGRDRMRRVCDASLSRRGRVFGSRRTRV